MIIGLTEQHGMAQEQAKVPPTGIDYRFLEYQRKGSLWLKSPMKGFMSSYKDSEVDLVEAILTPAKTNKPWLYSLACYEEAVAFNFLGLPLPKSLRIALMNRLFLRDNFKGLLFWSEAGRQTLKDYGNIKDERIWNKSHVVYPAIRPAPKSLIQYSESKSVQFLFNGNFFIKGGANVVDVFEQLQLTYPNIKLRLCCNETIDFHTDDAPMRDSYLQRIKSNPSITMGRVKREVFLNEILPQTDIYLLPTYGDAFGFAILEAMSFGIPVVSTNYMAVPEMIEHGVNGYMVDIKSYECKKMFKGCYVSTLPSDFKDHITRQLLDILPELIESPVKRRKIGEQGVATTADKFSFEKRRMKMAQTYQSIKLSDKKY